MNNTTETKAKRHFLTFYTPAPGQTTEPPTQEHMAALGNLSEEMIAAGLLITTGMILPSQNCFGVKLDNGSFSEFEVGNTFADAAGFALFRSESKETAVDFVKTFLQVAGAGKNEVFEILIAAQAK